tara:strand:- start:1046 stop:1750 length:705 start_codon:yes stop_codon:yes gene_type:complete
MKNKSFKNNLSVIILCGGMGKRLYPITKLKPKPLVKINKKEMLTYIIEHLKSYNLEDIVLATGYKHNSFIKFLKKNKDLKKVRAINTGKNSDILKRIIKSSKETKKYILVCYGDTLADVDIDSLIVFFKKNLDKIILSSYNLKSQFGLMKIGKKGKVLSFEEKPNLGLYFNIGFFLFKKERIQFFNKFNTWKNFLENSKSKIFLRSFIHKGKHITVNTIHELEEAEKNLKLFIG